MQAELCRPTATNKLERVKLEHEIMLRVFILIAVLTVNAADQGASDPSLSRQTSPTATRPAPKLLRVAMPSSFEDAVAESELLAFANNSRRQAGLPLLRFDAKLIAAARAHARLMVAQGQLSHQFQGEASLMSRLRNTGIRLDSVGENVAYDSSPEQAFDALMH